MKKLSLLLLLALPAAVPAADNCAKNADACAGGKKISSPFAAASLAEIKQGRIKKEPELKPAARKKAPEPEPVPGPAAQEAAPAASTAAVAAAQLPVQAKELSSPFWLFFVGGSLAGLYFYLRGGARKGRR